MKELKNSLGHYHLKINYKRWKKAEFIHVYL